MSHKPETALRELRRAVFPVPETQDERARRERIGDRVNALQRELSAKRARSRRFGFFLAVAALVAGMGTAFFFLRSEAPLAQPASSRESVDNVHLVSGQASVLRGHDLSPLDHGQLDLSSDPVLVTRAEETAELRLSSNTEVSVAPASELGIARRQPTLGGFEERLRLRAGSLALRVPKLGAQGRVSIETRDTLVEVHGTQFTVRVIERQPLESFTEVDVREGRVLVRSGDTSRFLGAGDHWSSRSTQVAPNAEAGSAREAAARAPARREPSPEKANVRASELAAQNRLLEAAELAQRSGMPELALQRLETLITRYPNAELAHNARVERFRVLDAMGKKGDALAAARAYLERHPKGFARTEAERLIVTLTAPPP
jgi:hypothetical protein